MAGIAVTAAIPAYPVLGAMLGLAGLTAIPARIGARRPAAAILQSEPA